MKKKKENKKKWVKKEKKMKKRKREKNKKERKKEGIYKKWEWERKGVRVSQLALHTSKAVLCARLQAVALHFNGKNISPPGSTQPCSHTLAKSCHNSHPLPTLHSVASSPNTCKEEECSSYDLGPCYSTLFGTCSYAKKGDVLCTSNPKA